MKDSLELVYGVRLRIDFEEECVDRLFLTEDFLRMTSSFPEMVLDFDCRLEAVTHACTDAFTVQSRAFLLTIGGLSFLMCAHALND